MKKFPATRIRSLVGLALLAGLLVPFPSMGQDLDPSVQEAYFRAVAEHFEVPMAEVAIIGDWDLDPDEVPVVLFLSRNAGVSPDALIGLRRRGQPWREVAQRFGVGVRAFHIPLPEEGVGGVLTRAYREFRAKPSRDWNQIELEDLEIIALVNLRVISEQVGVSPLRVLQSRDDAGSFAAGFARLLGRSLPR